MKDSIGERRLLQYAACIAVTVAAFLSVIGQSTAHQDISLTGRLVDKVRVYREYADRFDTLFLGDSRTYCAIHPHRIDRQLGTQSVNLASWAHWLPTQYAQIKDLVDHIPPTTTVIWSVGYQNFHLCEGCTTLTYPIGRENAEFYAELGLPKVLYEENVETLQPLGLLSSGMGRRQSYQASLFDVHGKVLKWLQAPAKKVDVVSIEDQGADTAALLSTLRGRPHVALAEPVVSDDRLTSVEVVYKHGGYERIELDSAFFREKQRAHESMERHLPADPAFVKLFEAGLDLFSSRNLKVIVNVMEEAPHSYPTRDIHLKRRQFMDSRIREAVESRGFDYIRVDFDEIESTHYFDYNHLNSNGVLVFTNLFSNEMLTL